jgi:hypothetical protein
MKIQLLLVTILLFAFATAKTFAQIPNSGFENWGTSTFDCNGSPETYVNPTGWVGGRSKTCGGGYSIQKVTDSYPVGTGQYSIMVKSDTAKSVNIGGIAMTGNVTGNLRPIFPITGHPTSLKGYYKFAPLNGDTMHIAIVLFQNGIIVTGGAFTSNASASNWSSFNIPLPAYTAADSGIITLAAYNNAGPPPQYVPHGNSVLSVDNLNFDNLIIGISETNVTNRISFYPNPFSSATTFHTDKVLKKAVLAVYNAYGQLVKEINNISGQEITLHRDHLACGLYFIRLTEDNQTISTEKLLIKD